MTDADLENLEALAAAATPGPWEATGPVEDPVDSIVDSDSGLVASTEESARPGEDTAFIAAARDAVPALIAEVRRLRARPWERMREMGFTVDTANDLGVVAERDALRSEVEQLKLGLADEKRQYDEEIARLRRRLFDACGERNEARCIARALWLTHDGPGSIGGDPDWLVKP